MLKRIIIENFKAFKSPAEFELRPLTVIIGKNSSGKSSLCKLLKSLSNSASQKGSYPIPLNSDGVVLGSSSEDLFHNRETSGMLISMSYDGEIDLNSCFLMMNGAMLYSSFEVRRGTQSVKETYNNVDSASLGSICSVLSTNEWNSRIGDIRENVAYDVDYIGPIRSEAKRTIARINIQDTEYVGYRGENAYELLLNSYLTKDGLFEKVSRWFAENMDGQELIMKEQGVGTGMYSLYVKRNERHSICIADVGEGINQLLPIIVQSYIEKERVGITVIEQPSLHLHPAAHAKVAYRLADAVRQTGKCFLVETHSENFLLGLRYYISQGLLSTKDVIIYSIDHDGDTAICNAIEIDDNFEYTDWPEGVFEEDYELLTLINKQRDDSKC